jgi:WD40 repeat protein
MVDILNDIGIDWSSTKLFEASFYAGAISPNGLLAQPGHRAPIRSQGTQIGHQIVRLRRMDSPEFDLEMSGLGAARHFFHKSERTAVTQEFVENYLLTREIPEGSSILCVAESASSFGWSPSSRYLATGTGYPDNALRIFDTVEKEVKFTFVRHRSWIYYLYWSAKGNYLVSSSHVHDPRMLIWKCEWEEINGERLLANVSVVHELTTFPLNPDYHFDKNKGRWIGFYGYKNGAISPNEKLLAVNASMRNSADYLLIYRLPEMEEIYRHKLRYEDVGATPSSTAADIQFQISSIHWTHDSEMVFFSQAGLLYSISLVEIEHERHPRLRDLSGDMIACNPCVDLIAIGHGAYRLRSELPGEFLDQFEFVGGEIAIHRVSDLRSVGEFTAPAGITSLRWSEDGARLWCMCTDGTAVEAAIELGRFERTS